MAKNHIFPFLWMRGESEEIMRTEMAKIDECGIKAVCVEARPHDEFCKEGWWHDMDIIIDEAKKRDMRIWILDDKHFPTGYANGLIQEKYPERKKKYIAYSKTIVYGYPHRQLSLELGRMLKPAIGFWEIEDFFKGMGDRFGNQLLKIVAVKTAEGKLLHEETIDLTGSVSDGWANFTLPEGVWTVYVIFKTTADGGDDTYINLIDSVSAYTQIEGVYEPHYEHYKDEFGKTIAGFFSDESQFGNIKEVCYDAALGKPKMHLPWSDELEELLKERFGESYTTMLPFLFQDTEEETCRNEIRYAYMDCVSRLYKKCFSDTIGRWCEDHGVEYIGHVVEDNGTHSRLGMGAVHYFRAMSGQHMAGVDDIGEQVQFGAPYNNRQGLGELGGDGEFYHYTLAKLGTSCGHLDPRKKGRTMCELFGAYGWNFGVRDQKYVLDHLLVRGVNELVPHAFSMAEFPDQDCPPHFYARGNNGQFPCFARLMKYANRLCDKLSDGQHVANAAVLYDGEGDWLGQGAMPMQKVIRQLIEHQIDLDIVPMDMLEELPAYQGELKGDKLLINGVSFDVLFIPYMHAVPAHFAKWICQSGDFPVIFAGDYPASVIGGDEDLYEEMKKHSLKVELEQIAEVMAEESFTDICVDVPFKELSFCHYVKDGSNAYMLLNESSYKTFRGRVELSGAKELVVYDGMADTCLTIDQRTDKDGCSLQLLLTPGQSIFLEERAGQAISGAYADHEAELAGLSGIDLSADWRVSRVRAIDYPAFPEAEAMAVLEPISVKHPEFAGVIRYRKTVKLAEKPAKAVLCCEQIYEVMTVTVNGQEAGVVIQPPYQVDVTEYLTAGENELLIEVATTPSREQLSLPRAPFDFNYEAFEATGMAGEVILYTR